MQLLINLCLLKLITSFNNATKKLVEFPRLHRTDFRMYATESMFSTITT